MFANGLMMAEVVDGDDAGTAGISALLAVASSFSFTARSNSSAIGRRGADAGRLLADGGMHSPVAPADGAALNFRDVEEKAAAAGSNRKIMHAFIISIMHAFIMKETDTAKYLWEIFRATLEFLSLN